MSTVYEKNIGKVKAEIEHIISTDDYKALTKKQKIVAEYIFKKILASSHAFCSSSNRTIAEKCNVSTATVNRTRLALAGHGFCEIIKLKNGKRTNPRYRMQLANVTVFSYEKHAVETKLRESAMKDFKLANLKDMKISDLRNLGKVQQKSEKMDIFYSPDCTLVNKSKVCLDGLEDLDNGSDVLVDGEDMLRAFGNVNLHELYPEDFPESNSFKHVYLKKFDKSALNEKFWDLMEQAAEAEENGFKVGGIFRNEVGEVFKGQLRHSSEWLLRAGKVKRLKDLYLCLVAASSENLMDYATRLGNRKLLRIAEDCSDYGFYYMLRRKQENLFNKRAIINGFAVLCPSDVVCIDNDKALISNQMLGYVKDGFIQESPSANGRFHAFVKDSAHVLHQFNVTYGFEVLGGNKQIFFQAVNKAGKLMFSTIGGTLDSIGELSPAITETLSTSFTYAEWYGKSEFELGANPTDVLYLARNLSHLETIAAKPDFYYELNSNDKLYFNSEAQLQAFENRLKKIENQVRRQLKFDLNSYEMPVKIGQNYQLFQNFQPANSKEKYNRKYMVGERNNCLFKYGRYLRCLGYSESIIEMLMANANTEQCLEPITDNELRHIVKSVIRLENKVDFNQYIPLFSRTHLAE